MLLCLSVVLLLLPCLSQHLLKRLFMYNVHVDAVLCNGAFKHIMQWFDGSAGE